jgi:hypothetical protein
MQASFHPLVRVPCIIVASAMLLPWFMCAQGGQQQCLLVSSCITMVFVTQSQDCHLVMGLLIGAGKWGYYALWAYGSLAMAIFMVRTMKRVIFQEAKHYGESGVLLDGLRCNGGQGDTWQGGWVNVEWERVKDW